MSNIRCWLQDDDPGDETTEFDGSDETTEADFRKIADMEPSRVEKARHRVVKSVNVRAIPPQRRLVVTEAETENGTEYNLHLEKKITDENGVGKWIRKRCIASGEPENPLL